MAKDLYDRMVEEERKESGKKNSKIIAVVLILVVLVSIVGFVFYSGIGATIFGERIVNSDQAADTLSDLGNDIGGISNDLKEIENNL
jgi:flagellar basal body-associated protein FliL